MRHSMLLIERKYLHKTFAYFVVVAVPQIR